MRILWIEISNSYKLWVDLHKYRAKLNNLGWGAKHLKNLRIKVILRRGKREIKKLDKLWIMILERLIMMMFINNTSASTSSPSSKIAQKKNCPYCYLSFALTRSQTSSNFRNSFSISKVRQKGISQDFPHLSRIAQNIINLGKVLLMP